MVVYLDLTEKTIDCFNECAKKGNYNKFVEENQKFIRTLSENLKKVEFPFEETLADRVSQNCKFYFDYLTRWNPKDPRGVVPGTTLLERYTPCFVGDLKHAISTKNWNQFYSDYYATADFMIKTARNQGVLDFQIEKGSGLFESFRERDLVVASMQHSTNDRICAQQNTPLETKNSKEMILNMVPNPESQQSGTKLDSYHSGNHRKTIIPIEDTRADTPKHDSTRGNLVPSQREQLENRHTVTPVTHTMNSDHSTNGSHGSKSSESYGRWDSSPGIRLIDVPISEQPSNDQRTTITTYENLDPLPYTSLRDVYKNASLRSAPHDQTVDDRTRMNQISQPHAQVPRQDVIKHIPQERRLTSTRVQDSEHTIIPSEYKPGFSADDAVQNREFHETRKVLSAYKDRSLNSAPHNQPVHDTTTTNRATRIHRNAHKPPEDVPKQNPHERYSRQSTFNTLGEDSQHTITTSEYKPGFSADDALRAMEPGMTFNGTLESLSPTYNPNQAISDYREDMNLATLIPQTTSPIYESLNNSSSSREMSLCRDSPMFDNTSFDMELAKQNLRNAQELEAKREERKKKQKEFDEELKTLKEESKQRFQMLLKCIMMRRRFEEQEQHWMDWIAGCRHSIGSFLNRWYDFYDDVEKSHKGFRRPEIVDHDELQRDTGHFLNSIMVTFNVMECDFEHMERIGRAHPDTMFVKVLMKCIADIAHELLRIYNFTQHLGTDQSKFLELQSMITRVNPNMILSTDQLRSICRTANPSDYQYVSFPDLDRNLNFREL
ncbi:hypothetical protein B9Z55_016803 [Caenorhabditis nigoni]|uniref:Uncharacterized protein n=2 Tax=Caenorhabditis nigoni TaxID=1611254 RepID=A0A2G5T6M2_9PELO|nr:hypothetical protein B9Z55_016803 [Caenorhabditis nigoni]